MILIFGGNGFVGQHVAHELVSRGEKVTVTGFSGAFNVPLLTPALSTGQAQISQVDITDPFAVTELVAKVRPKVMMDLTGYHPKALSPARDVQFRTSSLLNVLEAARIHDVDRVVLMSSMDAYWGIDTADGPFREDDPVPLLEQDDHFIVQSWVKKSLEVIGNLYRRQHGMNVVFVRASGIYGPYYRTWLHVPSRIARAAAGGSPLPHPLPFREDGYDQVYVKDMARGIGLVMLAERLEHPVYNIGAGRAPQYGEFVTAARKAVPGFALELPSRPAGEPRGPMEGRCMAIDRARGELGYEPRFGIDQAMAEYIEWIASDLT